MAGSFSKMDGVPDTLADKIGELGRAIRSQPHFNSEAIRFANELERRLVRLGYIRFTANVTNYSTWRTGEARLFFVPEHRRGALSVFRGKAIRLICVGSGRFTRELRAGVIRTTAEHRVELINALANNQKRLTELLLNSGTHWLTHTQKHY
jgi:hypothetical protein